MRFGLRLLWRDWRGGELGILAAAIILAVAIVTGISLFVDRLQQGIVNESSQFLAADRVLQSPRPVQQSWLLKAQQQGLEHAETVEFQSMVFAGEEMQLAAVKAVSDSYPLLGSLEISTAPLAQASRASVHKISRGPLAGEVWLDARLLPLLKIQLGDRLSVGEAELTVAAIVTNEPDRGSNFFGFGPRVLMHLDDIPATEIVQPGSRVDYRYLFTAPPEQINTFSHWLKPQLQPSHKWLDLKDSQPSIGRALERAESFLLLAGALGVGLAGIAIALAARRYSERHFDYVAMMKSLGANSHRIMLLYCGNLLVLGVLSALLGCFLGWLIQAGFMRLLQDFFNIAQLPALTLRPFVIGGVTALVCLLSFALPPLIQLQAISPLRVLRREMTATGLGPVLSQSIGVLGIGLLMFWYSGSWQLTAAILAGVLFSFIIVGGAAMLILRGSSKLGMQAGSRWHLALASMRRRGLQNAVQVVIFSLAIMLLLVLGLMRTSLIAEWQQQLPETTPNHFLLNISDRQVEPIARLIKQAGGGEQPIYPMVRGRLVIIKGEPVARYLSTAGKQVDPQVSINLDRELSLTWSQALPTENTIVSGSWWPEQPGYNQVSIEAELATKLDVTVGDELVFQIGSESLKATISSVRTLDWQSMRPNFYMIFPPAVLQQFPASYMTSFYLPVENTGFLNRLMTDFPTVTAIEMDAVINQVRTIITKVSTAIELVLALIVASGLLVLVASVQASLDSRFQESAILRTLGASRGLVMGSLFIEFTVLGFLAGLLAAGGAELSVYVLQTMTLDMRYIAHPWVWLAGPLMGALLIGAAGFISCRKVVDVPPVQVLSDF